MKPDLSAAAVSFLAVLTALGSLSCASTAPQIAGAGAAALASAKPAAGGVKPWPKNTCAVTGNELGSMGPVIAKVHQGQEVKFCCRPCVGKFDRDPDRYLRGL